MIRLQQEKQAASKKQEQQKNSPSVWCTLVIRMNIEAAFLNTPLSAPMLLCSGNTHHARGWGRHELALGVMTPSIKSGKKPVRIHLPTWRTTSNAEEKLKPSIWHWLTHASASWTGPGLCPTPQPRGVFKVKCHLQTSADPMGVEQQKPNNNKPERPNPQKLNPQTLCGWFFQAHFPQEHQK